MSNVSVEVYKSPSESRTFLQSVAKRSVCIINACGKEYEVIVSGIFNDGGDRWIHCINVKSAVEGALDPDFSNVHFKLSEIESMEFKRQTLYDLDITKGEAASIMRRTDAICSSIKKFLA